MYVRTITEGHIAVLDTLRGICKRYGKDYCFPSQNTILDRLSEFHGIVISKRTLNYWLKALVQKGLIYRIRRHTRARWNSTAYYIGDRAGRAVGKVKNLIGSMKRLRSLYPQSMQKVANDSIRQNARVLAAAPTEPHASEQKGTFLSEGTKTSGEKPFRADWQAFGERMKADYKAKLLRLNTVFNMKKVVKS